MIYTHELIFEDDSFVYSFKANQSIKYTVSFSPSLWFLGNNVYEISIANGNYDIKNTAGYDENLYFTIVAIISDFFKRHAAVTVGYVCDSSDRQSRGKARAKLFLKWFDAAKHEDFIHLQGITFLDEFNQEYHSGIIFQKDNPDKEQIQENFYLLNQEYSK